MRSLFPLPLVAVSDDESVGGDRVIRADAEVAAVAFSADGKLLAGACGDGAVRFWEMPSGSLIRTVAWSKGYGAIAFSSKSAIMASAGADKIELWDLKTGELLHRMPGGRRALEVLAFSPDGTMLAGGAPEGAVRLWDAASGKLRFSLAEGLGGTGALAFSPDGDTLAGANNDTNLRVWSTRTGRLERTIKDLPLSTFALAFSPDGKLLASGGADRTIYFWDASTWKIVRKPSGQPEMVVVLAFSPDGRKLLSGGSSQFGSKLPAHVLLWDISSGGVTRTASSHQLVNTVAFSPDGKTAVSADLQKTVTLWDVR